MTWRTEASAIPLTSLLHVCSNLLRYSWILSLCHVVSSLLLLLLLGLHFRPSDCPQISSQWSGSLFVLHDINHNTRVDAWSLFCYINYLFVTRGEPNIIMSTPLSLLILCSIMCKKFPLLTQWISTVIRVLQRCGSFWCSLCSYLLNRSCDVVILKSLIEVMLLVSLRCVGCHVLQFCIGIVLLHCAFTVEPIVSHMFLLSEWFGSLSLYFIFGIFSKSKSFSCCGCLVPIIRITMPMKSFGRHNICCFVSAR